MAGCSKLRKADCVTTNGCKWEKRCVRASPPKAQTTNPKPAAFLTRSERQVIIEETQPDVNFTSSFFAEAELFLFAICKHIFRSNKIKKYSASTIKKQFTSKRWPEISALVYATIAKSLLESKTEVKYPKTFKTAFEKNFPSVEIDDYGLVTLHATMEYFLAEFMMTVVPSKPGRANGKDLRNALTQDEEWNNLLKVCSLSL